MVEFSFTMLQSHAMRTLLLLSFCASLAAGCEAPSATTEDVASAPKGPDDPLALAAQMNELVAAARKNDPQAVLAGLEPFLATEADLKAFFGEAIGGAAWPGYRDAVLGALRKEAGEALVQHIAAQNNDEVRVEQVGPAYPARTTPGDQKMLDAMVHRLPMYTVRFHRPEAEVGLRLNGFVFHSGRWIALLKAYDHLPRAAGAEAEPATEE